MTPNALYLGNLYDPRHAIPESAFARYPALSRQAVLDTVNAFLDSIGPG